MNRRPSVVECRKIYMSAVRISVLLIVFWLLFSSTICYAAAVLPHGQTSALSLETVSEDNANRLLGNLEPVGNSTQIGNASEPVYSINAFVRAPEIIPGNPVEIEIYLSGFGIPDYDKLYINWTAPSLIDENNPGNWTVFGGSARNFDNTFAHSAYMTLSPGFFEPFGNLTRDAQSFGINLVVSEHDENGEPPILINLNTVKGAKSGDYQVRLTFTYGNETNLKQGSQEIQFHVLSGWERFEEQWQARVTIIGIIVAVVALIITATASIWQMFRWRRGK